MSRLKLGGAVRNVFLILISLAVVAGFLNYTRPAESKQDGDEKGKLVPVSSEAVGFGVSEPIRSIKPDKADPAEFKYQRPITKKEYREEQKLIQDGEKIVKLSADEEKERGTNPLNTKKIRREPEDAVVSPDAAIDNGTAAALRLNAIGAPIANFEGQSIFDTIALGQGFLPPDTVGDVGPNHYVQSVNSTFRVFNKNGTAATAVLTLGSLFAVPGACGNKNDGDPTINYDSLADRWVISQFCISVANPNNHQLIAVSQTSDPTGAYYLYDFMMPNNKINDYPKFGVWPNGYYMTDNQFNQAATAFLGGGAFAFDRAKMLAGDPTASFIYFDLFGLDPNLAGMLPSDADGLTPPPANAPNVFAYFTATEFGDVADGIRLFNFSPDFVTPANSTFVERAGSPLAVAAFDPRETAGGDSIEQPPPANPATASLNAISDRLMNRLQYRNFGTHSSLVLNHTVNVGTGTTIATHQAGVRYYELRSTGGGPYAVNESASYAPDTDNRWMGSAAMDHQGNLGIGYSVSSLTVFPSIRYAGRLAGDPANTLAQGEATLIAGGFVQANTASRWGDYSQLNLDPTDDCTFWYTQQYYSTDEPSITAEWRTRIGSFKVNPACAAPAEGSLAVTVTNCSTASAVSGATITIDGNVYTSTLAAGTALADLPPGTYSVTVSKPLFTSVTQTVTITNGGSTPLVVCLTGVPAPAADPVVTYSAESCAPADGALSPGETVTANFGLKNAGTAPTTNLVATLQNTGGVTGASGPQNYGSIPPDNTTTVSRPFTFTADPGLACGDIVTATLQLQDGATNLGTVTYTLQVGAVGAPITATYSTGNIATPIPDNGMVEIPISVPDNGSIQDVNVRVRLNHTFDGDLDMTLIHPDGTAILLSNNRGGAGQNFGTGANDCSGTPTVFDQQAATAIAAGVAPFAGSFIPDTSLAGMNGKLTQGTWKLRVADTAALDAGTVGCVTLEITRGQFVCCGIAGTPVIASGGEEVLTAESFAPANMAPDPGETVTVNLPLINNGSGPTTNLTATLAATGGVTSPSAPQNYLAIQPTGAPGVVSRPFTFTANGACGDTITLTLNLQDGATNFGTVTYTMLLGTVVDTVTTFSNTTPILVPAVGTSGIAGPYPTPINVAGVMGNVSKVTATLKNMNHTFPDDIDVLLVGPGGQRLLLQSDAGGTADLVNNTYTFDDAAAATLADGALSPSASYKPSNFGTGDTFSAPAPAGPYNDPQLLSVFNGVNPNGTWSLYVVDDVGGDPGNINGGWELNITTSAPSCVVPPPGANVAGTKTVSGTFAAGGTVTYTVVLTNNGTVAQLGANPGNEFVDVLPSQLTLVGATATSGTAGTSGNTVTWNGDLAPLGGSVTITITATVNSGNSGASVSNQGTINYDGDGNGTNEATRLTDEPGVGGASDPTVFTVAPVASVNNAAATEGSPVGFTVSLDVASSQTVTVRVNTTGNTATANVDYNNIDTFFDVVFAPGSTSAPVNIPTFPDTDCEGTETFFINIISVTNASVGNGQGVGTINDDETVTTTTVTSSQNPTVYGQSVTFTASVTPVPAGGTVEFRIDGAPVATVAVNGSGQATYTTTTLTGGSHNVVANYSGSGGSCPSSGSFTQQVNKAATTTLITGDANDPSVVGEPVTVTFTVTSNAPGSGTPTGIVTITMGGGAETCTGNLTAGSGSCVITLTQAGPRVLVATYGGDSNYLTSNDTDPHQVNRALTTTVINTDTPDPSTIGEAVTVTYTVAVVGPGAGVPTGTVTVTAAGGAESCTGAVSAAGTGSCPITLNSAGARNLTATYSGDSSFQGSASTPATSHTVGVSISGTITEFSTNANVAGAAVLLTCTGGTDTQCDTAQPTNASGSYTFANLTSGVTYTVTPTASASQTFDPISRTYPNVVTNITNANFTAYGSGATANPRTLRAGNVYPAPGSPAAVPILLNATNTERSVTMTILYSTTPLGTPTVACGVSASGCTVNVTTNTPGTLTFTITPSGAGTTFGPGLREIAKVTWPTFANSLSNTPVDITTTDIRDTANNPLSVGVTDGLIIFAQGQEGDVAARVTGDGKLLANDPIIARQFITREITPDPTTNEFMRMDAAPTFTKGNEIIDASDLVVIQNYVARNIPSQASGGAGEPTGPAPTVAPESFDANVTRAIRVKGAGAASGREVTVNVDLDSQGGEVAASFTLSYDSTKLSNPRLVLGQEMPQSATLSVNSREAGKLGILVDAPEALANGALVRVTFDVAAGAIGTTRVAIDDSLATRGVSNRDGDSLTTRYSDGIVSIDGALQSNVEISGRVLTPDGRGLRNTEVRITDASGTTRSTTTDSFGFYSFKEVAQGQQLTLKAISRTYRFEARRIEVTDNLSNLDLVGRR